MRVVYAAPWISFLVRFLLFSGIVPYGSSLDVSWIPSDPDPPLPLSSNYRASLRRLCKIIDSGSPLPPELSEKKEQLSILCRKLRADDQNVESTMSPMLGMKATHIIFGGLVGIGGGYLLWDKRRAVARALRRFLDKVFSKRDRDEAIQEEVINRIREARMKRFTVDPPAPEITKLD
jgi:hypothetical protein